MEADLLEISPVTANSAIPSLQSIRDHLTTDTKLAKKLQVSPYSPPFYIK